MKNVDTWKKLFEKYRRKIRKNPPKLGGKLEKKYISKLKDFQKLENETKKERE